MDSPLLSKGYIMLIDNLHFSDKFLKSNYSDFVHSDAFTELLKKAPDIKLTDAKVIDELSFNNNKITLTYIDKDNNHKSIDIEIPSASTTDKRLDPYINGLSLSLYREQLIPQIVNDNGYSVDFNASVILTLNNNSKPFLNNSDFMQIYNPIRLTITVPTAISSIDLTQFKIQFTLRRQGAPILTTVSYPLQTEYITYLHSLPSRYGNPKIVAIARTTTTISNQIRFPNNSLNYTGTLFTTTFENHIDNDHTKLTVDPNSNRFEYLINYGKKFSN